MSLYPKVHDESILLDNECKRLLKRHSRKLIIEEVMDKFSENIDNSNNKSCHFDNYTHLELCNNRYQDEDNKITNNGDTCTLSREYNNNNNSNNDNKNSMIDYYEIELHKYDIDSDSEQPHIKIEKTFYEKLLIIFGCNIK